MGIFCKALELTSNNMLNQVICVATEAQFSLFLLLLLLKYKLNLNMSAVLKSVPSITNTLFSSILFYFSAKTITTVTSRCYILHLCIQKFDMHKFCLSGALLHRSPDLVFFSSAHNSGFSALQYDSKKLDSSIEWATSSRISKRCTTNRFLRPTGQSAHVALAALKHHQGQTVCSGLG